MAIVYRIYANHGDGGPVDYSSPVATTAGLSYAAGPLGVSTDNLFVVRAYDTGTGLEQAGSEASLRVAIGPDGADASGVPNAPHALTLTPAAGGGARVSWAYAPAGPRGVPTGFDVYLTAGPAVDYSSPAATVPYTPRRVGYSCLLPGPYALSSYSASVRSFNAAGAEANSASAEAVLGPPASFEMGPVVVTIEPPGQ
jgi:hypothetical protein